MTGIIIDFDTRKPRAAAMLESLAAARRRLSTLKASQAAWAVKAKFGSPMIAQAAASHLDYLKNEIEAVRHGVWRLEMRAKYITYASQTARRA